MVSCFVWFPSSSAAMCPWYCDPSWPTLTAPTRRGDDDVWLHLWHDDNLWLIILLGANNDDRLLLRHGGGHGDKELHPHGRSNVVEGGNDDENYTPASTSRQPGSGVDGSHFAFLGHKDIIYQPSSPNSQPIVNAGRQKRMPC